MDNIKNLFKEPGAEFRTAPLWVWNSDMTDSEIEKSLKELKEHGFGGAFVHPRPGMRVSYMDEKWFETWGRALEKAKEMGLKLNIYDENSYPSGFGGGHVSAQLPDCLSESVNYQVIAAEDMDYKDEVESWIGNNKTILAYACDKVDGHMVFRKDVTNIPRSKWKGCGNYFAVIEHQPSQTEGWLAGFANVDLLRPEVTEKFLEIVYDGYARHFEKDFGDTIQAIFTDEPSLPGSSVYGKDGKLNMPINHWFGFEFQKRKGYDIMRCLPALFEDWDNFDNLKVRHDYYEVTQELWAENFLTPIQKWSKEHHLPFTGHFMEDGWPKPFYEVVSPSVMSSYEYQDWPGIDLLLSGRLKNQAIEVQHISMIEVMSAAHQFGKKRVFCEAYGAGGYDSGLEDYKRIGDYLLVNGVNFINEHLMYTSYIGARKRDHPQSFDWRQPWWNEYTELNDYLGRLSAVLSQGESRERILVLNPTTTGFLYPRNKDYSHLVHNRMTKEPDMQGYLEMIEDLKRCQWDINLGDEVIMKRHGKAVDGKLEIVKQKYDVVILHECMKNMFPSTIELLCEYMEQGGKILSVGTPGPYVSGTEKSDAYERMINSENFVEFKTENKLTEYLNENYQPYFTTDTKLPAGVESLRRVCENGEEIYFIVNHSQEDISASAIFTGAYMEKWDPWTGNVCTWQKAEDNGKIQIPLELKNGQSVLLCVYPKGSPEEIAEILKKAEKQEKEEIFSVRGIIPEDKNVWPLEYCDLEADGEIYHDYSTIAAGNRLYKKRGFLSNPWDNEVQYKTRTYDRNRFYGNNSGFAVTYYFDVAKDFRPEELSLSVEYGGRYDITVNGKPAEKLKDEYFLDELIVSYDITDLVQEGKNEIRLEAKKFDVELEIEPVVLRGSFGVYAEDNHWIMDKTKPLVSGNWQTQGYPFYYGAVLYEGDIDYDGEENVEICVPKTEATAISVWINGVYRGNLNLDGIRGKQISKWLVKGENSVAVRVCASMKNCLGPHFDSECPRRTAWPDMWKKAPKEGNPSPEEYDLILYGLEKDIKIRRY